MNTQPIQADEARINQARAHAAQHRIADAEALYRDILKTAPDTPEALNFVAMCALSRGEFASAGPVWDTPAGFIPPDPGTGKNSASCIWDRGTGARGWTRSV